MMWRICGLIGWAGVLSATWVGAASIPDFSQGEYTVSAWIKTAQDGPIVAKTLPAGNWVPGGKALFVRDGVVSFDVGWVGDLNGRTRVVDHAWHHVVLTGASPQRIYVDGKLEVQGRLREKRDPPGSRFKIGIVSSDFPLGGRGFTGRIDDVRVYGRSLAGDEIVALAQGSSVVGGLVAHWPFNGSLEDLVATHPVGIPDAYSFAGGKFEASLALVAGAPRASGSRAQTQRPGSPAAGLVLPGALDAASTLQSASASPSGTRRSAGIDKILFVKRLTYSANHYYTEFINSRWTPGGNLCVLDLTTGEVADLAPELEGGVFERFDLDFDARHVVFAWKAGPQVGYRLYEIELDPESGERVGNLKQLTFPREDEADLVKRFRVDGAYHHGTDDMHPCYLPDGDICFISTRCQYGILCDAPDNFTTTVLYRMDRDGGNVRQLSTSSVSEASPSVLPDGRILYTRWEYVDKGAVSVKCLWAMKPDGSSPMEIYGADIALPPTFLYGRAIPDQPNHYVFLGTPHCPQNGMGTVIRIDMHKPIRTREPMTYMTPYVDIRAEGGFSFMTEADRWTRDGSGGGPLFKDPYPLSGALFLVSYKPPGPHWDEPAGYALALLDEQGAVGELYRDPEISCWLPYPFQARPRPPVLETPINPTLARQNLARCIVTDVYHGMEDVEPGAIKHLRVIEQVPRPWATRRRWGGDGYDQQHATITKDTHLGLKVQHGVVPVEDDGSAHFLVPAHANISFQALDENYLSVQTERTFVNYLPGETRSCIGCHETPDQAVANYPSGALAALQRAASVPGPQPGETNGQRALDYRADVQPVLDAHCIECHQGEDAEGGLRLTGELTEMFCLSYEQLIPERRDGSGRKDTYALVGPTIGENHPKTGNVHYLPARALGSHSSILVAMLAPEKVSLADPGEAEIAATLAEAHKDLKLSDSELLRITNWVDTNSQYYGMYWGRKNLRYRDHPNFRPTPTFERATSPVSLIPEADR